MSEEKVNEEKPRKKAGRPPRGLTKMIMFSLYLDPDLLKGLTAIAHFRGIPRSDVVREGLKQIILDNPLPERV